MNHIAKHAVRPREAATVNRAARPRPAATADWGLWPGGTTTADLGVRPHEGGPASRAGRPREGDAESRWLREVFADAVHDVVPSPVPLAAVIRDGRRLRRRRSTVLGALCGLLLVSAAGAALYTDLFSGPGGATASSGASGSAGANATAPFGGSVRIVTPGERVPVAPGVKVWLTKDGEHWSAPDSPQPVRTGPYAGAAADQPGITLQEEGKHGNWFLSGVYHGAGEAARVEVETAGGRFSGSLLTLAGKPGWGVWYAEVKLPGSGTSSPSALDGVTGRVTVYDSSGGVIARTDFAG
ncbi:hypothetical protein [Streptomyces sp. NPDC058371]|uniref:hypothetical protein n=1 Tax=Streptomyces sp. NPDC058371 TaxID=3346463 RepID=UPI003654E3A4